MRGNASRGLQTAEDVEDVEDVEGAQDVDGAENKRVSEDECTFRVHRAWWISTVLFGPVESQQ